MKIKLTSAMVGALARRVICAVAATSLFTACASTGRVDFVAGPINDINRRAVLPERPMVAAHAGTVVPGYFEIEAGVEHDRFSNKQTGLQVARCRCVAGSC